MKSIRDRQAEGQSAQPGQRAAPGQMTPGGGEQLSPEEQEAYTRVVMAGGEIIFGDKSHDQIMQQLQKGAGQPEQTIAQISVTILNQLDEQSGNTIPEEILLLPIAEFIEQLAGLGAAAGFFQADEDMMQRAAQIALTQAGSMYGVEDAEIRELIESIDVSERDAMVASQRKAAGIAPAEAEPAAPGAAEQAGAMA